VVRLTQRSLHQRAAQGRKAFRAAIDTADRAASGTGVPAGDDAVNATRSPRGTYPNHLNRRANPTPGPAGLAARGWLGAANRWVRLGSDGCACAACGEGEG